MNRLINHKRSCYLRVLDIIYIYTICFLSIIHNDVNDGELFIMMSTNFNKLSYLSTEYINMYQLHFPNIAVLQCTVLLVILNLSFKKPSV